MARRSAQPAIGDLALLVVCGGHALLALVLAVGAVQSHRSGVRVLLLLLVGAIWASATVFAWQRRPGWRVVLVAGALTAGAGVLWMVAGELAVPVEVATVLALSLASWDVVEQRRRRLPARAR